MLLITVVSRFRIPHKSFFVIHFNRQPDVINVFRFGNSSPNPAGMYSMFKHDMDIYTAVTALFEYPTECFPWGINTLIPGSVAFSFVFCTNISCYRIQIYRCPSFFCFAVTRDNLILGEDSWTDAVRHGSRLALSSRMVAIWFKIALIITVW